MFMLKIYIPKAASSKAVTINQGLVRPGVTTADYSTLVQDITTPVGTIELLPFSCNLGESLSSPGLLSCATLGFHDSIARTHVDLLT